MWVVRTLFELFRPIKAHNEAAMTKRLVMKFASGNVWLKLGRYMTEDQLNSRIKAAKRIRI